MEIKSLKNRKIGSDTKRGKYIKPAEYDKNLPYNSERWRKTRFIVLSENPLCPICGELATEVHHKEKGIDIFFSLENLISLCTGCHDQLQAAQKRGWNCDDILNRISKNGRG